MGEIKIAKEKASLEEVSRVADNFTLVNRAEGGRYVSKLGRTRRKILIRISPSAFFKS